MSDGYAGAADRLAGVAERMATLAERLDRGARLVDEGTDESGRVSVAVDRAGLAETIRIRADWRSVIAARGLPHTIAAAYGQALSRRLTAALEPSRDRFASEATDRTTTGAAVVGSARVTVTTVPADQLARSFDRLSAHAWEHMESLQRQAAVARSAPPTGTGIGAAGRVTVVIGIDLRLDCRIDDRWADPQTGAGLMNTLNPALHAARDDLAQVSEADRFPTAGAESSALLDEFLALLNDPHRFAEELATQR